MANVPSLASHMDVVSVLIGALFVVIAWFIARTLKNIDKNQGVLAKNLGDITNAVQHIDTRLARLEGEHRVMMQRAGVNHHE